ESLARSGTTPQRVAQKCRVILLAQEGMSNHSIAKQLGLSRPTVIAARTAFGTGGVQVLTAKPTRNRPRRTLTPEVEKKILDTTLKTRPPDATQWTVRTLAQTRCTIMRDTRRCLASVRTVHCVASGGLVLSVVSRIFFSTSGVRVRRGRFRVGFAVSTCTPPVPNAVRAAITVGRDRPSCLAIE